MANTKISDLAELDATPAVGDFLAIVDTDATATKKITPVNLLGSALPLAGGTMSGSIACADNTIVRPEIKDYSETTNPIGGTGGGTQDIDIELGNVVEATVDTSANTFTFSNPPDTAKACSFTLILVNGGSQTVNWPAEVAWAGGSAPTLTASGTDILTFLTVDNGAVWYGFAGGLDMK
jgi:hypothetical protein